MRALSTFLRQEIEVVGAGRTDAVCIAFIANEALSILENAGLMGMPIPEVLRQAIDILNGKAEKYTESRGER